MSRSHKKMPRSAGSMQTDLYDFLPALPRDGPAARRQRVTIGVERRVSMGHDMMFAPTAMSDRVPEQRPRPRPDKVFNFGIWVASRRRVGS
jgi:hypothetical protein